jgi:hypothetical protein
LLWRLEVDGEARAPAASSRRQHDRVFAAGASCAARAASDLAWRFAAKGQVYTAPALTDDGLVIVGSRRTITSTPWADGALSWSTDLGADVDGAAVIGDRGEESASGTDRGGSSALDSHGAIA